MFFRFDKPAFQAVWPTNITNTILVVYLVLILPAINIWLGSQHWLARMALDGYIFFTLMFLLLYKNISIGDLGLSTHNLKENLTLGCFAGATILACLPALDLLIEVTRLSETELISNQPTTKPLYFSLEQTIRSISHVILDQLFFFGLIAQNWLSRRNTFFIVYLIGVIFAIAHAKLTIGVFAVGLIGCLLYSLTGTLIASGIFQIACLFSGFMLETTYSRLATLLGFLF